MEQNLYREANSRSASQEIPHLLWNPKIHCSVHKNPPLIPLLSQMNPVQNFSPYFCKFHANIIILSTSRTSK